MPTPRQHGGAALQHYPLNVPAFKGLNKQSSSSVLSPEWATRAENTVLDDSNRLASRKGWSKTTTTPATGQIKQIAEYNNSGTYEIIAVATNGDMLKSTDDGATWSVITGAATVADTNMQFMHFNGSLFAQQISGDILIYNGAGNFANLGAAASMPKKGVGLAAFGRLWGKDTDTSFKYSALLTETDFVGGDTGTIDMTSIWQEQDTITALAEFNNALVVFSENNVVIFKDNTGSVLGIDPTAMTVVDTVRGIGCIARDSIVNVKGDLWFLDNTGVYSLGRLLQTETNPLTNISANVQDEIVAQVALSSSATIRAAYSPKDRFYLLSLPSGSATSDDGVTFCFDTQGFLEDGSARCAGIWTNFVPRALLTRDDLDLISTRGTVDGSVGVYDTYLDGSTTYVMEYESGWSDMNDPNLKILKRVAGLLNTDTNTSVTFKWAFDFDDTFKTATTTFGVSGIIAEWNLAEFSISEFGGGVNVEEKHVGGRGTGDYIKIGMTIQVPATGAAIQQLSLFAKQGRIK